MKKLQEEKTELESKLSAKDEEVNTLKLLSEQASSKLVGVFVSLSIVEIKITGLKAVDCDRNHGDYCNYCVRGGICFGSVCLSVYDEVIASFHGVCSILLN